jgi:hypothetical protein
MNNSIMPRRYFFIWTLAILLIALAISQPTFGQADICPALVQRALSEIGSNCTGLGRNSACYGFDRVEATFYEQHEAEFFSQPADIAELFALQTISTAGLDVQTEEWGIAVLNVQANLPDMLPGQAATFLLMGDVEMENAAPLNGADVQPIEIAAADYLNIRSLPSERANVLVSVPPLTQLITDGLSDDGRWLRVTHENQLGWVSRDFVQADNLDTLLPVAQHPPSVMQAFYLRTGVTGLSCEEAPPSLLVVQSPQHLTINLTINGANLELGSTVAFSSSPETGMQIGVLDGHVAFEDGTRVEEGETILLVLDEDGQFAGEKDEPRPFTAEELQQFSGLEQLPDGLLSYTIEAPEINTEQNEAGQENSVNEPPATPLEETPLTELTEETVAVTASPLPTIAPTATPCPCSQPAPQPLTVAAPCVAQRIDTRTYEVTNPNNFDVPINWSIAAPPHSGTETVPANGMKVISVPGSNGNGHGFIINVSWSGGSATADSNLCAPTAPQAQGVNGPSNNNSQPPQTTPEPQPPQTTAEPQPSPAPTPTLETSCVNNANAARIFTVSIAAGTPLEFAWSSVSGQGGLISMPTGGTTTLAVVSDGSDEITLNLTTSSGEVFDETSEVCD